MHRFLRYFTARLSKRAGTVCQAANYPATLILPETLKFLIAVFILVMPFKAAAADEIRAFHNINQLPFKQIFGLPSLDNKPLAEAGRMRMSFTANLSNTYDISANSGEYIVTDSETLRTSVTASYALRNNWQIGIEVPCVRHSGGFLDDFIYDWHDFWGMPQNGRDKYGSDQMPLMYLSPKGPAFSLSDSAGNLGDIRINSAYTLPWENRAIVLSAELKLPTGDFSRLTGSGSTDFSVGILLNDPRSLEKYRVTLFVGLAGIFLGDIDGELADIQNNFAVAGRAGIGWQATELFQLKAQIDALSGLYDSSVKEMGESSLQAVFGTSLTFSEHATIDISIAEDVKPCTAADVAFQIALTVTY